ncbi:uncharacterized protein LTR77_005454 [Saxophila tyrrhenica]|uniref:Uncharacterized protein n=1 Tax=Saxophila tyrrhenica TaxID=1690608 RepID=A0AAV9P8N4_9PEZI|nr:hypothetical protein LTR77_005454 [Saxophila tyrrhenica]
MSGTVQGMKDAVTKGEGGGLQGVSQAAGQTIAENTDTRGGQGKKSDDASTSLGQFGKGGGGNTTEGTSIKASDQVTNMQTGSADHLEMGFGKDA